MIRDLHTRFRQWLIPHGRDARAIAIICLGCAVIGLVFFDPPKKVGYFEGEVIYFGVRHSSKRPGARIQVRLPDGRDVWADTRAYVPGLQKGARLCLLRTKGRVTGRIVHQIAQPSRCA